MQIERVARLQAMGITVWLHRPSEPEVPPAAVSAGPEAPPRVRISAGTGDWLLVTHDQPSGRCSGLVEDIGCTIGRERCLFGRWAASETAGTGLDEVQARGIRWVLSLGSPPAGSDRPGLLVAADLETLARNADARRALWELIEKPLTGTRD